LYFFSKDLKKLKDHPKQENVNNDSITAIEPENLLQTFEPSNIPPITLAESI
jgi:hypothetical protein